MTNQSVQLIAIYLQSKHTCSLLSGLEGSDALVKQVAEGDRVIVEKISDGIGLRAAHILLLGSAHGLV